MGFREKLIKRKKSIIIACDVEDLQFLRKIVEITCKIEGVGGYKIGSILVAKYGILNVLDNIKRFTNLPVIYDHQKGGTDIPELGPKFTEVFKDVDGVILFPFGGPETQKKWTEALQEKGIRVLIGGHMTQKKFLSSEGGYIDENAPEKIYQLGAKMGVQDFVVPGNKIELVAKYKTLLDRILGSGNFTLYAPGFIKQGGVISETAKVAGKNWHAIVGSAIYQAKDIETATKEIVSQIV